MVSTCGTIDKYLYYCIGNIWSDPVGDYIYKYDGVNPATPISWHPPFWLDYEEVVHCLYYSPNVYGKLLIITGAYLEVGGVGDMYSRVYMLDPSDDSVTLFADWFTISNYNSPTFGS